jgi:hypothetical protein
MKGGDEKPDVKGVTAFAGSGGMRLLTVSRCRMVPDVRNVRIQNKV